MHVKMFVLSDLGEAEGIQPNK